MNDDLDDRLDTVERRAGVAGDAGDTTTGLHVYISRFAPGRSSLPERYKTKDDDGEPTLTLPKHYPAWYCDGPIKLDESTVRELWDTMPEDAREREREHRREHGEPIPPVLDPNGGSE